MKSIRGRLLLWLLPGFVVSWLGAGIAIDSAVRSRLENRLEADLRELLSAIPFGGSASASLLSLADFNRDDFGIYFQVWGADGARVLKSNNLGWYDLEVPASFAPSPVFGTQVLGNGDRVQTLAIQRASGVSLGPLNIMVAKTREDVSSALWRVRIAIVLAGAFAGAGFGVLVALALQSGLKPLDDVTDQVEAIDAGSLEVRFPENLPVELRPVAAKLNELMDRLQASFERERRFSGDLAHELRTPLAALRATSEYAVRWPEEASVEEFKTVGDITSEMESTVERLLMLATLDGVQGPRVLQPIQLRQIVDDCWKLHQNRAEARGVILRNEVAGSLVIKTDPELMRMVISNLVSNASDYAPPATEILAEAQSGRWIRISNAAPQLTESDLPHLFERFWRRDGARSDSRHSGLGLPLAQSCAEALRLRLSAELDAGGTIHFYLYLSEN